MNLISPNKFWEWAYSDFMSNSLRGVLAEFIVALTLGCTNTKRTEWDAYDILAERGLKIEVKTSAYLQSWSQTRFSNIRFDIGRKKAWDAKNNSSSEVALRSSDIYVFCVFASTDIDKANPLDLDQWFFLVCPTQVLEEKLPNQKTIGLASLEALGLPRLTFGKLKTAIYDVKN